MQQIQVLLFGTFWIFFQNIVSPLLVESMDVGPEDAEDCLYPLQSYREPLAILEVISDVAHVLWKFLKNTIQ